MTETIEAMRKNRAAHLGKTGIRALGFFLIAASAAISSGCSDEAASPSRPSSSAPAAHQIKWLEVSSPFTPAQWLVSRGEDRLRAPDDPEVKRIAEQLATANALYRESERMIANRAAQLSEMLASRGINEAPTSVLDDLTEVAGDVAQTQGFGAVTQHYFNLRAANLTRDDALSTLKSRYGQRSASHAP